jgi:hypothetical protein
VVQGVHFKTQPNFIIRGMLCWEFARWFKGRLQETEPCVLQRTIRLWSLFRCNTPGVSRNSLIGPCYVCYCLIGNASWLNTDDILAIKCFTSKTVYSKVRSISIDQKSTKDWVVAQWTNDGCSFVWFSRSTVPRKAEFLSLLIPIDRVNNSVSNTENVMFGLRFKKGKAKWAENIRLLLTSLFEPLNACGNTFEPRRAQHVGREISVHDTDFWSLVFYLILLTCVTLSAGKLPAKVNLHFFSVIGRRWHLALHRGEFRDKKQAYRAPPRMTMHTEKERLRSDSHSSVSCSLIQF